MEKSEQNRIENEQYNALIKFWEINQLGKMKKKVENIYLEMDKKKNRKQKQTVGTGKIET